MTSWAATRPLPSAVLQSVWETIPRMDSDSMARTISFSAAGNTSMTRSIVLAAELVWSVPNTKWPVSAAVRAKRMVSKSRISPTRITSGSSRSADFKAFAKLRVFLPSSRWLIKDFWEVCTNSMGSSTVKMCAGSLALMKSTMAARVVDLPEPVGPVTRTIPRGSCASWRKMAGALSSSSVSTLEGIVRNTAAAPRCWL